MSIKPDFDTHRPNPIVRYREQLPIPRYWLRRTVFLAMFAYIAVAGSLGALPTLPELGSRLWDTVASVDDTPEERLLRMVEDGKIRPARQSDIDQWFDKARLSKKERANASLYVYHTFVVLEGIRLPRNMYGAHSKMFIIPDGVPLPKGERGHNSFYLMENGTCIGGGSTCAIL